MRATFPVTTALALALAGLLGGCAADSASTAAPEARATQTSESKAASPAVEPMLSDPTGSVYRVTTQQWDYPFVLQGIGTKTFLRCSASQLPPGESST